eukprot:XP_011666031.1 PREDICTED: uncharacterized protein LOC100891554 isoform X1 [Strongylocentrotus purpuratus]
MAAKAVEKLVRELVCAVCMNTLKNPKSLSCRHTFCEECLKQCDKASQGRSGGITCPMCREVTTLSREGVAGLKSNPLIYRVLEVLEATKNSTQIICDACGDSESPLTTYCRDCLHFICDSCASSHAKMKLLMKDHRTVPLDKIENGTIQIKWMEEGLWRKAHECEEHGGELRRFYCRTCKKRICRDCIVLDHTKPDHDCTTMRKMFQETKEKLTDRLKSCEEKEEHVSTMLNDVDVQKTEANQKFHKMKETIRDQKSKAVDNLDKAEEELLQKVNELEEKLNVKLQAFRDNMNTTKENLTRAQSKAKEVVSAKEVTDISRGPFLPEHVLKELEELIASDVTMTISMDLVALKSTMIEGSKMPEQMARFAKLSLSRIWRETQMIPIPDKDIVNIFSDGKAMYVACKKVIYKKLLSSEAKPSIWLNLQLNASIKQVVDVAISMKDQTFSFIADTDAACTQLYRFKLDYFPTSDEHTTVPPCPLNPSARLTVDSQSLIVVADNKPAISSSSQATPSGSEPVSETKQKKTTSSAINVNAPPFSPVVKGNSNKRPMAAAGGGFTFGMTLPQQQPCFTGTTSNSQTVSAFGSAKSPSKAEGTLSPSDSKGKETRPEIPKAVSDIFTISTKIYREKTEKSSSQLSSDNFEVPLDRVRSLAAAKTGQLVFLRGDKKAVIITDKDGRVQHEIKEPGRMYLSISCTECDALYVLSAFWGSHIVTLAKHSLEDGGPLEYIIDELDVSADFQSDEWPVIGNYGNDLVIMHTGDGIRVYSAEDWDILDDKDVSGQDQDDDKEEDV